MQKTQAEEALGMELPTRRVESFHYTDLRTMLREIPDNARGSSAGDYAPLVDTHLISFNDGKLAEGQVLPKGVTLSTDVAKAVSSDINDAIIGMNAVTSGDAVSLTIEGNATMEKPLGLGHFSSNESRNACYHKVLIKSGSEAQVISRHTSTDSVASLANTVTEIEIEKDATAHWFVIQQESTSASRLARINVSLAENAKLNLFILNAGGKLVRQEVKVDVEGEGAHVDIKGVNLIGDDAHIDVTTVLEHNVPNSTANELFRNVVAGNGHGVFQGQIKVAQIAQKTDAQMACNTLLLTDDGDFSAKPELEIFADDVLCAHGATVTDIDDDHLFYLRARGIKEKTARALLIKAFVDEVVEEIGVSEELEEAFIGIIDSWLDKNT